MNLKTALGVRSGEVIAIIGAGGKTTLMFSLAQELLTSSALVITTTTTKIYPPSSDETCLVGFIQEESNLKNLLAQCQNLPHITLVSQYLKEKRKLAGISPKVVDQLKQFSEVKNVLVEADGAARRPFKAPRLPYEPVVPSCVDKVIVMMGAEVIGKPLTSEYVFRWEIASQLSGLAWGKPLTIEAIQKILLHPQGPLATSPSQAEIVLWINKLDLQENYMSVCSLAEKILSSSQSPIQKVVLGQLKKANSVVRVMEKV